MAHNWTFGQKIGMGFAITVTLTVTVGVISVLALHNVVVSKDHVINVYGDNLVDAERIAAAGARATAASRDFLLDKGDKSLLSMSRYREEYQSVLLRLSTRVESDEERDLLKRVERADSDYRISVDRLILQRKNDASPDAVLKIFEEETLPRKMIEIQAMDAFIAMEQLNRSNGKQQSNETASSAITLVLSLSAAMALLSAIVAYALVRTLGQQVGTAVGQIQTSSDVLQAAASKQSTGAKEKVTVMNEITTTIIELLATSRQIAENAQRVASVAEQAVGAARSGDGTVQQATQSIEGIRRQVDLIVGHMLELGKKSQQIGAVLGIVSELAEQTNILAINATIEAVGAGETGRRFAVVAEEIRKLADRIAGSTKEIHGMIEDVRGAVNTTVMATETGSKAVDAGNQKFSEVAAAFKQIAGLVSTTTEAAREIELSTKEQASAVEQVNGAIANVVQATLETEEIAIQTRKTGFELALLSGELSRLIQPQTSA